MTTTQTASEPEIIPDALIHDLAIVLRGALHPSAQLGLSPRMAARRIQDVLCIEDGHITRDVEDRLRAALSREEDGDA